MLIVSLAIGMNIHFRFYAFVKLPWQICLVSECSFLMMYGFLCLACQMLKIQHVLAFHTPNANALQRNAMLGMAIWVQPMGIGPRPTRMGRILLNLIKNRVGYGFFKKKTEAGPGSD